MENKRPTSPDTDIASPAQSEALQLHQSQRVKDMAEALIEAFEATPLPKDYPGLEKAAKALIGLNRLLKAIYAVSPTKADKPVAKTSQPKPRDEAPKPEAQKEALSSWMPKLNHKLERLAEKRRVAFAAIPDSVLLPP